MRNLRLFIPVPCCTYAFTSRSERRQKCQPAVRPGLEKRVEWVVWTFYLSCQGQHRCHRDGKNVLHKCIEIKDWQSSWHIKLKSTFNETFARLSLLPTYRIARFLLAHSSVAGSYFFTIEENVLWKTFAFSQRVPVKEAVFLYTPKISYFG